MPKVHFDKELVEITDEQRCSLKIRNKQNLKITNHTLTLTLNFSGPGYDIKGKLGLHEFYGYALLKFRKDIRFGQTIFEIYKFKMMPFF